MRLRLPSPAAWAKCFRGPRTLACRVPRGAFPRPPMGRGHVALIVLGVALLIVGCAIVPPLAGLVVGVVVVLFVCRRIRKRVRQRSTDGDGAADLEHSRAHNPENQSDASQLPSLGPRSFSYEELSLATGNFDESQMLGKGGSGHVFKGTLPDDDNDPRGSGQLVAVKCIDHTSSHGIKEFLAEVTVINDLRHRNLVRLRGWCQVSDGVGHVDSSREGEPWRLLLVYDLMPNGSLDSLLFNDVAALRERLTWPRRLSILQGLASALLYLHEECEHVILHRDIKSSNIMLDKDFNARLGDFGLSRQLQQGMVAHSTTLAGTKGYLAPELCFGASKATKESDVYSFGAVLLEVPCGKRALDPCINETEHVQGLLVDWVWGLHSEGKLLEAVDARLGGQYDLAQMWLVLVLGLACSHPDPKARPTIRHASEALQHASVAAAKIPLPSIPLSKPTPSYYYAPDVGSLFTSSWSTD